MKYYLCCMTLFLISCTPVGDAMFRVKGSLVDEKKKQLDNCVMEIFVGSEKLGESTIAGNFSETVVYHPTGTDDVILKFRCEDYQQGYQHIVTKIPSDINEYIDIGIVELKK